VPSPRSDVTEFLVSVAVSFKGEVDRLPGRYVTFTSFNPASQTSQTEALNWLEQYYVSGQYKGIVITDFDEVRPRFPQAVFGLPDLLSGKQDLDRVRDFARDEGLEGKVVQYINYYIENVQGDKITVGNISNSSGIAIGRDAQATT
jgi:hypothetical protein